MTVSSSTRKAGPFNCNDVNTSFPFTFKCFTSADIRVVFTSSAGVESDLALDVDYTVSLNSDQNSSPGGSVETMTAYATGEKITVVSDVDFLQETDIQNQGGFYPEVIENALDKVTMQIQQVKEEVDRAVKVDVSSSVAPEDYLNQAAASATSATASASAASASAIAADASADAAAASASEIDGFEWLGSWVTATAYVTNNLVNESGNTYIALADHTSGTFSTDFSNGLWAIFASKGAAGSGAGDMLAANNLSEVNPDTARANLSAAKSGAITGSGLTQAASRVIGRSTAGTGAPEELTLSQLLDFVGSAAQGDLLYRGESGWSRLAAGTSGQYLKTQGAGANPTWDTVSAGGITLLATVAATSGNSVSVTGLDLTGYTFLEIIATNISSNTSPSNCYISSDNNRMTSFYFGIGSASEAYEAWGRIHLPVSADTVMMMNGTLTGAGITGAINANTTTIYFRLASTHTFNNATGAFKIYGVK